jgi:transcriptional regulator with XRE-family HTH domain
MKQPQEPQNLVAFGKKIAELRSKKGLTQEQLAEKTSLAQRTIASIEQGRRWARLTTLHKLAKGLGVSTDELFKGL